MFYDCPVVRTRFARVGDEYSNHYTINACRNLHLNFALFLLTYTYMYKVKRLSFQFIMLQKEILNVRTVIY
jgi:hypothetical protein